MKTLDMPTFKTVKSSLQSIARTPEIKQAVHDYVVRLNRIIRFSYLFARFIFVNELAYHTDAFAAVYSRFVTRAFFQDIIKTLGGVRRVGEEHGHQRLIDHHLRMFLQLTGYNPADAANNVLYLAHNASLYASIRMETDYLNIVQLQFGKRLRQLINHVLGVKELTKQVRQAMIGRPRRNINRAVQRLVTGPAQAFKSAFTTAFLDPNAPVPPQVQGGIFENRWEFFHFLRGCYHRDHQFAENSIYADAQEDPRAHLYAFYSIAKMLESTRRLEDGRPRIRPFQCMPLINSWIPHYVMIDTSILRLVFLNELWGAVTTTDPLGTVYDRQRRWNELFHVLNDRQMLDPRRQNQLGDINLNNNDNARRPFAQQTAMSRTLRDRQLHIEQVDVHFRGTIYTDGVGVSILKTDTFTTANNARNAMAQDEALETFFYVHEGRGRDSQAFRQGNIFLADPGRRDILFGMHQQSNANNRRTLRFTNNERKKIYKTKKYTQIRQRVRSPLVQRQVQRDVNIAEQQLSFAPNKVTINPLLFSLVCHIRGQVDNVMQDFYCNTLTKKRHDHQQTPLHRKLKLSSTINRQTYYNHMANRIRQISTVPGQRPHLVLGDHSNPNMTYHEPVPGAGLRRRLRQFGFHVSLVNEYLTSQLCPLCLHRQHRLENFRVCRNPRPAVPGRLSYTPLTVRWGLLRCTNLECQVNNDGERRIWNRDMAAVLNFCTILNGYIANRGLHPAFRVQRQ